MPTPETAHNESGERETIALFAERLNAVLDDRGYSKVQHKRYLQLNEEGFGSTSGVRKWCIGEAIPGPGTLARLCRHLGVSIDYLLGLTDDRADSREEVGAVVEIPIYVINTDTASDSGPLVGHFKRIRSLLTDDREGEFETGTKMCLVECWDTMRSPAAQKGDLLYVELTANCLIDNQVYLLRTPTTVWIRRVRSLLDGRIELAMEYADRKEANTILGESLQFSETGTINVPAPDSGVTVIGQVLGRLERYSTKLPGLA